VSEANAEQVTFSLNGQTVEAGKGELVIDAAERSGVHIPRFCYHPRMRPVGMCRMCIVDIDTGRGATLQPSCMIPVAQDMVVETESEATKKAQDGVLEFLLINHPLDCPVCDKGGECPLQDNAYAFGPGESRFVEEKRHFAKPIPISDLVLLDRERCILCDRCTRFAKDVAGDPLIHFQERGNQTEVNTFPDHPFASYFSGNTVQICPVGALTAAPFRFKARPWDLAKAESTCTTCSFGCGISVESSRNHLLRRQGVDVDPVNWGWMCDKGRFAYEASESEHRLTEPLHRVAELEPVSWGQALGKAADALRPAMGAEGAPRLGVIGGARLTNESAYAWAKLAKGVLGTDNVDCQLGDGLPPEVIFGMPRATIDDVCADGGVVVVLAPDLKEELPVLHLRLRDAVLQHGVRLIELAPQSTSTSELAMASLRYRPGEAGLVARALVGADGAGQPVDGDLEGARAVLAGAERLSLVIGRPSVAEAASTIVDAAAALHGAHPTAGVLPALRRANVHGALDMGLSPGLLPGHVAVDAAGDWFTGASGAWDAVPDHTGLDTAGILAAAADGTIDTIVLLGADPLADFPDHDLARRALERATVIAVDTHHTASVAFADVVLPAAGPDEVDGTTTNIEGRILQLAGKVTPPGTARADWHIAAELAHRLGRDLGLESVDAIWDEIERVAPSYAGITAEVLKVAAGRTGVLMPLDPSQLDELGTTLTLASRRHGVDVGSARAALAAAAAGSDAERMASQMEAKAEQSGHVEAANGDDASGDGDEMPAVPPRPPRPALLTFEPPASPTELPQVDAYGLRLVASRTLYDLGTQVAESRSLAGLAKPARIRLNPVDLARLGLGDDARVAVSSPRGNVELDAVADPAIPPGSAGMFVNHEGADPADLLDIGAAVTTIQVQTAGGKGSR
jgi:NADH-quinone oxidoreductase subunit G